jgi:hypothetical protein
MLDNIISDYLLTVGIDLSNYGIKAMIWNEKQVIEVLCEIYKQGIVVLGGDVYKFYDGRYIVTGDSWYYNGIDASESYEKAIDYIKKYAKCQNDNILFGVVIKNRVNKILPCNRK